MNLRETHAWTYGARFGFAMQQGAGSKAFRLNLRQIRLRNAGTSDLVSPPHLRRTDHRRPMDPITTSITAALAHLGATAVKDAYAGLKTLLVRKFGAESKVAEAVDGVEARPESEGRKTVLAEVLAAADAAADEEFVRAAGALAAAVEAHGGSAVSVQQTVHGDGNVFSGTGNVSVRRP
jgi:hypothetical protein